MFYILYRINAIIFYEQYQKAEGLFGYQHNVTQNLKGFHNFYEKY